MERFLDIKILKHTNIPDPVMLTFKCQYLILQSPLDGSDKTTEGSDPVQSVVLRGKTRVVDASQLQLDASHPPLRAIFLLRAPLRKSPVNLQK